MIDPEPAPAYRDEGQGRRPPSASPRRAPGRIAVMLGTAILSTAMVGVTLATLLGEPRVPAVVADEPPAAEPSPGPGASGDAPAAGGAEVTPTGCASMRLRCERVAVPVDELGTDGATMDVVFGRHAAADTRRGTLVIATGGPGSSGLDLSEYYLQTLSPSLLDHFDIVFFDQRGVGRSGELGCPRHEASDAWLGDARFEDPDASARAEAWTDACLSEAEVTVEDLAAYDAWHAAHDLERYRAHLGVDRWHIYGESYGTVIAQHYAAAYPDRVAGLILDAPVDTALGGVAFVEQQLEAFWGVAGQIFDACATDRACAEDMPAGGAQSAWDELLLSLEEGPRAVELARADGTSHHHELHAADLILLTLGTSYTEYERMVFLRALAAAAGGDLAPVMRLAYQYSGRDTDSGELLPIGNAGSGFFLAVHCRAFADLADRDAAIIELEAAHGRLTESGNRLASTLGDELPCFHGFGGGIGVELERPAAPQGDFATLVLTASADPATPLSWAERVAETSSDGYLVKTDGGGHVTYGLGLPCPDDLVADFLLFDELPRTAVTECPGYVIEPYVPLLRDSADEYRDIVEILIAMEEEIALTPHYFGGLFMQAASCPHGGELRTSLAMNQQLRLDGCELLADWPMTGTIVYRTDGVTTMSLDVPGGAVEYESSPFWEITVTGTLDGEPIDESRTR